MPSAAASADANAARREGQEALAALDRALAAKPGRDDGAWSEATRRLCAMRDALIRERRAGQGKPGELERLNAVISSALAGHFPLGQTPWPEVEKAREMLADLAGTA